MDPYSFQASAAQRAALVAMRSQGILDADQFAQTWNQSAADDWSAHQTALRSSVPEYDPAQALAARYGGQQSGLGEEARRFAAQRFLDVSTGNVQATFKGSRMTRDPEFQQLYRANPQAADSAYQRAYGQSIQDAMAGDIYGGNLSLNDVRARRNIGNAQKSVFEYMRGVEGMYGANAMDLVAPYREERDPEGKVMSRYGYNPQTGLAFVPGKRKQDPSTGDWFEEPARQVPLSPGMYAALQNQIARLEGYQSAEARNAALKVESPEEARKRRDALEAKDRDTATSHAAAVSAAGNWTQRPLPSGVQLRQTVANNFWPFMEAAENTARRGLGNPAITVLNIPNYLLNTGYQLLGGNQDIVPYIPYLPDADYITPR